MLKWLLRIVAALGVLFLAAFYQLFLSSRPPLTTDPAALAGDGSTIDYCDLPVLDGRGKRAAEIPKGNTPGCSYTAGEREFCPRTSASMIWNESVLEFHVFGWGPVVVRRYPEGDQLVWEYADGSVTRMKRICNLPESDRIPRPRGPRYALF